MDQRHSLSPVSTTIAAEPTINRPSPDAAQPNTVSTIQADQGNDPPRPGTPPQPPYSPVTPELAHLTPFQYPSNANGTTHPIIPPAIPPATSPSPTSQVPPAPYKADLMSLPPPTPPTFAAQPPPVPISESSNPDAIALRSAISILQLQKQQSLRDIQTLERMKDAAAADPEKFVRELVDGKLTRKEQGGFIDFNHEEENHDEDMQMNDSGSQNEPALGTLPAAQNVVRMPPINWAKYQVVGESLDKMHEEQLRRPSLGEPRRDEAQVPTSTPAPAPEYHLAMPYQPLIDKLESPTKAKSISKSKNA
ncbi:hypothetical protein BDW74DRAFT_92164 [Aspergillus multicolor]|uniref:uncharacterized protein n=1 Tax=Aspergillus multicolor TaxID=41759 RepID=UPI003CCD13E7